MINNVIPIGAEHSTVLHALVRKRAEFAGQVELCQAELRRLLKEIDHLDAAICIFNPQVKVSEIRPKRPRPPYAAAHGEVTRLVLDTLREAEEPVTSRQLAIALMPPTP